MSNVENCPTQHKMAWTTQQAIEALGKAAGNTPPIERVLKALGFLGDVQGLRYVLETAVELAPQFLALRAALPGLAEHIDCYLSAGALLQQLSDTQYFSDHHDAALSGSKRFPAGSNHEMPSGPVGKLLKKYEKSEYCGTNSGRDFLSMLWLIQPMRYLSAEPKVNRRLRLATGLAYRHYCMIGDALREDFASELPVLADGLASADLWAWLRALNVKFHKQNYGLGKTSPFRLIGFALARLNKEKPPLPANQLLSPPAPRALRLEERYLSIGHWGFPRPHELVSLQDFVLYKSDTGFDDPLCFEKLIVSLAAATGRTIEEVLHLHVDGSSVTNGHHRNYAVQELAFMLVPNFHGGTSRRAVWVIPSNRGTTAIFLPLPAHAGLALEKWVDPDMRGKIIDLLPASATKWLDRIEDVFTKTLGCTTPRANRMLRDSLLRLAYDKSANRAVVALLASNRIQLPKLERSEQLALSHYLDPLGARTCETYKESCRDIFNKFGSGNEVATTNCHAHGDHAVKLVEHQAVSEAMRSRVIALSDGNNPVELHNAYARYCLTLLIVATGHRRSRRPFFFPWDLHVNDRLAFICDKAVVGSEARFVPLAETTTNQIRAYFRHLLALRDRRGVVGPLVREHINKLVRAPSENHEAVLSQSSSRPLEAGLFFLIRENGSIETIGTGNLDAQFVENGFSVKVHKFRAALADALWGKGLSGIEVATLLGHSNELHPFGPASVWSVGDWAERIRPLIQAYLDERGWLAIESPLVKPRMVKSEFLPAMPRLSPDNLAYEGRSRERKLATIRARKAVRAVLSEDVLSDPNQKIDDARLGEIRARIAQILWSDDAAKLRVLNILEKEFDVLLTRGTTISAAAINLIRTDPSPVEISFGRHLALASAFRQQWINRVGEPIGGALETVERAAQLAISMVTLDGLLDSERVKQITLCAINTGEITPYPDALILRATVKTPRFEFDYSLLPGAISSALTLGLQKGLNAGGGSRPPEWGEIEQRVSDILIKTFGRNTGRGSWKVADLCGLFRPWWLIRLPGAAYSITIGDHNGPAPHPISEASLLAAVEPIAEESFLRLPKFDRQEEDQTYKEQAEALSLFRSILNKAAGALEHGTSRTRIQRAKLYRLLTSELDPKLAFWMREQAIIDALVGFIFRLLEQGGPREALLRFSSIVTYIDRIANSLVAEAWDADMEEMSVEDYEALYERVALHRKDKRANWQLVLRLFHQHLRESIGAPYISSVSGGKPVRQRCRSSLLTLETIKMAWSHLATAGYVPSAFQGPSKAMLVLGIGYGLRATEAIGLASDDFDQKDNSLLSVQKNAIRDLKSSASRRVIPFSILSGHHIRQLTIQRNSAKDAPGPDRYLFGSSSRKEKILSRDVIVGWIKDSLRAASANGYVVFHDLRRSFATGLTLAALPERSGCPVVQRARGRLVETELHDESFLRKLTRTPTGSPFLVDGIARILGHESVDTLHDVYAHGTFLVLADHARAANSGITVEDGRLAGMLGRDRTAIPHVRKTLMSRGKDGERVTLEDLTGHYINLYVRERASRRPARQSSCADLPQKRQASTPRTGQASWVQLDRLLCVRKKHQFPLEILRTRAQDEFGLPEPAANQLIEQYRSLVLDIGFDDFEPDESDLIEGRPARGDGVLRGQKEREASLAEAEKKYHAFASFRRALKQVCQSWLERVEPEDPWLVCKTQEELDLLLLVLNELGASANQIEFEFVGSVLEPFISHALRQFPGVKIHSSGRFSRGPKKARLVEVGARIRQAAGSRIGDGRDFHRLMLILTIGLGADAD